MDRVYRDLCLSKVVDLAQWLNELEDKILELQLEIEKLRSALRDLGRQLDLE
jgi:uncharacterized coiled-coil protein SlyX